MRDDILIVGAGVAGLAAARALAAAGAPVLVVDRAAGVGGRCATRRVNGRPVDHGVAFLHGSTSEFRRAVAAVDGPAIEGWPSRVVGAGLPCQPRAFRPGEFRIALVEGVSAFPKALARGLSVRLGDGVASLETVPEGIRLRFESGAIRTAARVLVALAVEQTAALLETWTGDAEPPLRAVRELLRGMGSKACLTVIAGYPASAPVPDWDVCYPEDSAILQTVVHDSAKRREIRPTVLVLQARPCWSRARMGDDPAVWRDQMVAEAGRLLGAWVSGPDWTQHHVWRYARVDGGCELSGPVWIEREEGGGIGFAGEAFSAGGGVEAAFRSGAAAARRVLGEERK